MRPTTEQRREKVFTLYRDLLKRELELSPSRAKAVSKSYLYQEVGELTGYDPIYVGRLIQVKLKEMGFPRKKQTKMTEAMDEEIKFILSL